MDFADYLYDKYELKSGGPKLWTVSCGKRDLCTIRLEPEKWMITLHSSEVFENPKFGDYDKIKELINAI
ncbi:MAG: hypothetical protein FWC95_03470 [Defluviitaleaceae bacterium]|nr:hypothetical protein [Defluviitaleaceae bacterium]